MAFLVTANAPVDLKVFAHDMPWSGISLPMRIFKLFISFPSLVCRPILNALSLLCLFESEKHKIYFLQKNRSKCGKNSRVFTHLSPVFTKNTLLLLIQTRCFDIILANCFKRPSPVNTGFVFLPGRRYFRCPSFTYPSFFGPRAYVSLACPSK